MAKKSKYNFKTKTINGDRHMICRGSDKEDKYFKYTLCDNYVRASDGVVAMLCSSCVSKHLEL
jgi:hypothetical protein